MIDGTLAETEATEFSIFLSGPTNFRYSIYPEYKANRKQSRPKHLADLKQYVTDKYKAVTSDNCEADDLLGIEQCKDEGKTIICSLDKDLRMIPGMHYSFETGGTSVLGKSWVKPSEIVYVPSEQALYNFYYQVLVGDPADNVKGAAGIGKVKAKAILKNCKDEKDMFEAVSDHFSHEDELLMVGQCLWIFRKENDNIGDRWKELGFDTPSG